MRRADAVAVPFFCAFFICLCCVSASDPKLLKRISTGLLQGVWEDLKQHRNSPSHATEKVAVWKSVPYGQAPVGRLRWSPPLPALSWGGVLDASEFRAPCVQPDGSGSEDCLHLHVTAPPSALNGSQKALPVLVYIHGGGLMDGGGMFEYMSAFALHANVVVVAINYRLNVFGWLALPSLQHADGSVGNYGMQDQQLALRWVRESASAFGGDPLHVTVAGQSSGGTSIFALFSSPLSVGLFDGAISMSGSINISMGTAQAFAQNDNFAKLLGCPAAAAECLRSASVQQLVQAQCDCSWGDTPGIWGLERTTPRGLSPSDQWIGIPVVDGVNIVLSFEQSLQAAVVDVPLVISNMAQECDLAPDVDVHDFPLSAWLKLLNDTFNQLPWSDGAAVAAAYANESAVDPAMAYASINADYSLSCGNVAIARAAKLAGFRSPIYVFLNEWHPEHTAGQQRSRWAFHGFDYGAAFEQWDDMHMTPSAQDAALGAHMREVFAAFMYGNLTEIRGWNVRTVDSDPAFPANAITNVVSISGGGSIATVNYKTSVCQLWSRMGLDERFWWIN